MRWSIRYQLLLPLFILLLGVVGISTWTALTAADRARKDIEHDVRNIGRMLSGFPGLKLRREQGAQAILNHLKRLTDAEFHLADPQEIVPSDSSHAPSTLPPGAVPDSALPAAEDDWQKMRLGPPVQIGGERYLGSGVHLPGGATLYIFYPERLWREALWAAVRPSLILGLVGGVVSLVLAVAVSQRLGRRIQALERRTRQIAAGDFSPMPLPRRNDELRDLSQSVNDMAQQLAQLQETVRQTERLRLLGQVSGGLAHQLRNGVTGARLAVQLHARSCDGHNDGESLVVALRQLDLVEANLKRFLDMGRTDELRRAPCPVADVVSEAVALLRPQCRHAHIDLHWQPPEPGPVIEGDVGRLQHLFLNVLGNAVEAAGPDGSVDVQMRDAEGARNGKQKSCVVEVIDSGPGPPSEIAERLFQPFVTGKREGVGLGLAVARQVAEAHGGSIAWRRDNNRTCFRIELPVS
jgi:signal transduction histidine kinase